MCRKCVKDALPERHNTCLDDGAYLLNWQGCGECGSRELPKRNDGETEKTNEDDQIEEETKFEHLCSACSHVVCEHYYKFSVADKQQEYFMECILCGKGSDTVTLEAPENVDYADLSAGVGMRSGSGTAGEKDASTELSAPATNEATPQQRQQLMDGLAKQLSSMNVESDAGNGSDDEVAQDEWD
mmetsp:Transcript_18130/g.46047  ORF Transcript_18130/g.46047 Transcript_18130/m.46047 type:complete len:185 (+) Transcript_18130:81-635(+)